MLKEDPEILIADIGSTDCITIWSFVVCHSESRIRFGKYNNN
jgi:hypothetical protein